MATQFTLVVRLGSLDSAGSDALWGREFFFVLEFLAMV
jgi:hypothetical protein